MMTRRKNVAMRESNDNIDHKNIVITSISFADQVKIFGKNALTFLHNNAYKVKDFAFHYK